MNQNMKIHSKLFLDITTWVWVKVIKPAELMIQFHMAQGAHWHTTFEPYPT